MDHDSRGSSGPCVTVIAATALNLPAFQAMAREAGEEQDQGSEMARLIEGAGRVCYDSYGKGRDSLAFHRNLTAVNHLSVIEHASLSFFITGISRGCSQELLRHRHASVSQRSTRYVNESESEWAWHPALSRLSDDTAADPLGLGAQLETAQKRMRILYREIVARLEPVIGRKQARGAARGVLGNALETQLIFTCNLRELRHIIQLRATPEADAEIRLLVVRMHEAALPYCPEWLGDYQRVAAPDGLGFCLQIAPLDLGHD